MPWYIFLILRSKPMQKRHYNLYLMKTKKTIVLLGFSIVLRRSPQEQHCLPLNSLTQITAAGGVAQRRTAARPPCYDLLGLKGLIDPVPGSLKSEPVLAPGAAQAVEVVARQWRQYGCV